MTTIAAPQERTPRVLRAGALGVLATTVVTALVALVAADGAGVRAALLGGAIVLVFFVFGALSVGLAAQVLPQTALLVAMLTYTLQVVLVGMVFSAMSASDVFDHDLREGWLAAGLIAGTLAWMVAQVVTTLRTPIPPWEGPVEAPAEGSAPGKEVDAA